MAAMPPLNFFGVAPPPTQTQAKPRVADQMGRIQRDDELALSRLRV
jgi:hypothetical protein